MGCCVSYTVLAEDAARRGTMSYISSDPNSPSKPLKRASHVASAGNSSHSGTASSPFLGYGELSLASSSLVGSYAGHGLHTAASAVFSEGAGSNPGSEVTDASAASAALSAAQGATPDAALRALLPVAERADSPMRPEIAEALSRTLNSLPDTSSPVSAARAHRTLAALGRPDALDHAIAGERRLRTAGLHGIHGALLASLYIEAAAAHARSGNFAAGVSSAEAARDALTSVPRIASLELRTAMLLAECSTRREDLPACARASATFVALGRALDALSLRESASSARANLYCARARTALRLAAAPVCMCARTCAPSPGPALEAAASLAALALRLLPLERPTAVPGALPIDAALRRAVHHVLGQTYAARAAAGAVDGAREKALLHFDEAIRYTPWDDAGGNTLHELQMQRATVRAIPPAPPRARAGEAARVDAVVDSNDGDEDDDGAVFSCASTTGTVRSRRSEGSAIVPAGEEGLQIPEAMAMGQKDGVSVDARSVTQITQ